MRKCVLPQRFKSSAHLAECAECQSQVLQQELAENMLEMRARHVEAQRHSPSPDFMQKLTLRLRVEGEAYLSPWEAAVLSWRSWPQLVITIGTMAVLLIALATATSLRPAVQEEEIFTANTVESASVNGFWMGE